MNYIDSDLKVVGTRPIRPDGVDKVTGRAVFAADMRVSGMLWGKVCARRTPTRASCRSTPARPRRCRA